MSPLEPIQLLNWPEAYLYVDWKTCGSDLFAQLYSRATVKSAKVVLDSRATGRLIVFEWFAVTVTATKWEILVGDEPCLKI